MNGYHIIRYEHKTVLLRHLTQPALGDEKLPGQEGWRVVAFYKDSERNSCVVLEREVRA